MTRSCHARSSGSDPGAARQISGTYEPRSAEVAAPTPAAAGRSARERRRTLPGPHPGCLPSAPGIGGRLPRPVETERPRTQPDLTRGRKRNERPHPNERTTAPGVLASLRERTNERPHPGCWPRCAVRRSRPSAGERPIGESLVRNDLTRGACPMARIQASDPAGPHPGCLSKRERPHPNGNDLTRGAGRVGVNGNGNDLARGAGRVAARDLAFGWDHLQGQPGVGFLHLRLRTRGGIPPCPPPAAHARRSLSAGGKGRQTAPNRVRPHAAAGASRTR